MEIVCTKDEGLDTQLTEGSGCGEICQVYKPHGRRERMLLNNIQVCVKRGTEFHQKLEAGLYLGLVCRRISPHLQWCKSNRETHQEPATTEDMGLA